MNGAAEPSDERVAYVLSRINAGVTQEWSQIQGLRAALERMLKDAQTLGQPHIPADQRSLWDQAWCDMWTSFGRVGASCVEAQRRFTSTDPRADPLEPWQDILSREDELSNELTQIRMIGAECILGPSDRALWNDLYQTIERQVAMLNAYALAVRFQLELRGKYGSEKADALTKQIAMHLPKDSDLANAEKYAAEYRQAWRDFEREKYTYLGVADALKSLMLIQPKSPEERVADKHSQHLLGPPV
jgi:hypothetical protein